MMLSTISVFLFILSVSERSTNAFSPHVQPTALVNRSPSGTSNVKVSMIKFEFPSFPGLNFPGMESDTTTTKVENDYDEAIDECKKFLVKAAETKKEDPDEVLSNLESLEQLMRKKRKTEPETAAAEVLENLNGEWRLIFTTGTKDTQKKLGAKINYFPIKAVQGFSTEASPMKITNGIYLGDFSVLQFFGDFEFDLKKSKLEFDFDQISVLGFMINLGKGKAAEIGASTGLGSENNKKLVENDKKAFFNWISADENIATARGGGGGLALWKRVIPEEE